MKYYIPRHLLFINRHITVDPTLFMVMQKLFEWANEAGLNGQKVWGLALDEPNSNNPLNLAPRVYCKIDCTEEQRKQWEAQNKADIENAVLSALTEDE